MCVSILFSLSVQYVFYMEASEILVIKLVSYLNFYYIDESSNFLFIIFLFYLPFSELQCEKETLNKQTHTLTLLPHFTIQLKLKNC